MSKLRFSLLVGFILGFGTSLAGYGVQADSAVDPVQQRLALDAAHKQEFLNLNFSYEGLGMHLSPDLVDIAQLPKPVLADLGGDQILHDKFGMNIDAQTGRAVGLFRENYRGVTVGALGCVACHSGRAAGRFYVGLGNKNIDVGMTGKDGLFIEKLWKDAKPEWEKSEAYKKVEDASLGFFGHISNPDQANLTQGLVPTAMIRRWFYEIAGEKTPVGMPRAAVKVPSLYGYGEKKKVGQFCDGGGDGNYPGWAIAVELAAGQDPANIRMIIPKINHAEDVISDFLPPKYPFEIDTVRAERGKQTFENTCAHCHGTYENDANGFPVFKAPKLIPLSVVKTDGDREAMLDEHFIDLVRKNPLNDIIREANERNFYFAPRLHAVWARFPYLHNGSVPSVRALLTPADLRPKAFSLHDVSEEYRFDKANLGMTLPAAGSVEDRKLLRDGQNGVRSVYWVGRVGQSNQGHEFYTDLKDSDKDDLIEYLKTL
jgi:hypothetical protein